MPKSNNIGFLTAWPAICSSFQLTVNRLGPAFINFVEALVRSMGSANQINLTPQLRSATAGFYMLGPTIANWNYLNSAMLGGITSALCQNS